MALVSFQCAWCGHTASKEAGHVNRSRRDGLSLFCDRKCAGLSRRDWSPPSKEERVADKSAYDRKRRVELADRIRAEKAAYHKRTYDPKAAAVVRKRNMPRHVEYCRRPEYKARKADYDRQYRAQEYGPFADAFMLLQDLQRAVLTRASRYEIDLANGKLCKTQKRKRLYDHESSISSRP